jgi:hypothetical protein
VGTQEQTFERSEPDARLWIVEKAELVLELHF